jgi:hypothetical protein
MKIAQVVTTVIQSFICTMAAENFTKEFWPSIGIAFAMLVVLILATEFEHLERESR